MKSWTLLKLVGIGLRINVESSLSTKRGAVCLSKRTCDIQAPSSTCIYSKVGIHTGSKEEQYKPRSHKPGGHKALEEGVAAKIEM